MARIEYPRDSDLPQELVAPGTPTINLFRMLAHSSATVLPTIGLGIAQFGGLELGGKLRELVTLVTARAVEADYEWVQHIPISAAAGVTEGQRAAIARDELTADEFDETEIAAMRLAVAVVTSPRVDDKVFGGARRHLTDRQIVETIGVVGYYWMLGRLCTVLNVDIDAREDPEILEAGLRSYKEYSASAAKEPEAGAADR